MVTSGLKQLLF